MAADNRDEQIDGAKIAAAILSRMAPEARERIVKQMQSVDPQIAQAVQSNLFSFDDIATLSAASIQAVIKESEPRDLVVSLQGAPQPVRNALLANMSERRRQITAEELTEGAPVTLAEVRSAQLRVVATVESLRARGLIRSSAEKEPGGWVA